MAFNPLVGRALAVQGKPGDIDTVQRNQLQTHITDALGNEYVYLAGAASVVAGTWCLFEEVADTSTVTLMTHAHIGPVAIATAAILAANWGWFQVKGVYPTAVMDADAGTAGKLYIDGTPGAADDDGVAGDFIFGAHSITAPSASAAKVYLNYPWVANSGYLT